MDLSVAFIFVVLVVVANSNSIGNFVRFCFSAPFERVKIIVIGQKRLHQFPSVEPDKQMERLRRMSALYALVYARFCHRIPVQIPNPIEVKFLPNRQLLRIWAEGEDFNKSIDKQISKKYISIKLLYWLWCADYAIMHSIKDSLTYAIPHVLSFRYGTQWKIDK